MDYMPPYILYKINEKHNQYVISPDELFDIDIYALAQTFYEVLDGSTFQNEIRLYKNRFSKSDQELFVNSIIRGVRDKICKVYDEATEPDSKTHPFMTTITRLMHDKIFRTKIMKTNFKPLIRNLDISELVYQTQKQRQILTSFDETEEHGYGFVDVPVDVRGYITSSDDDDDDDDDNNEEDLDYNPKTGYALGYDSS